MPAATSKTTFDRGFDVKIISREQSKAEGLPRYFTGNPCKHGHVAERQTSNGTCLECKRLIDAKCYENNRDSRLDRVKSHYRVNADRIKSYQSDYRRENKDKINSRHRSRYASDPSYRLTFVVRKHLRRVVGTSGSEYKVGYSSDDLRTHIESLWQDGMSWDNYGDWHIDHVIPIKWFIENDIYDVAVINSLVNLRPLWAIDNLVKGARVSAALQKKGR